MSIYVASWIAMCVNSSNRKVLYLYDYNEYSGLMNIIAHAAVT